MPSYITLYISLLHCSHTEISFLLDLGFCNGNAEGRCISLPQKSAWWTTVGFSVSFTIHIRIVNTMCNSREKAVRHYVDLVIKVFDENSEITQRGRGVECQLRTSKSAVCSDQNFATSNYFSCFSLSFDSLLLHSSFFIVLHVKRKSLWNQFYEKTRENKFENKSKNASHTGQCHLDKRRTK